MFQESFGCLKHYRQFWFKTSQVNACRSRQFRRHCSALVAGSLLISGASFKGALAQDTPATDSSIAFAKCEELSAGSANDVEAAQWCKKAADAGLAIAQVRMAYKYINGRGVPKDLSIAAIWARKAAEQNEVHGEEMLATLYRGGLGVPKDYAQSLIWARKAADQGSVLGQYTLGLIYGNGWGVPRDYQESVKWHRLAADQGYDDAQAILGNYYEMGWGVPRDHAVALQWTTKAADQGNANAKEFLKHLQRADNQNPETKSFNGLRLSCLAKNGDSLMMEISANRTDVQYGGDHYQNGKSVSQTDSDAFVGIIGRVGVKYETVQYVRVGEDRIEFGDSEHWYALNRFTGILNVTFHKKFEFSPIHCGSKRQF